MPKRDPVPFKLTLKQGWFGHFTGSVNDDVTRGMPGTGVIDGYFSFPRIEFTKQMPICYVATPDGRHITLREFLIEQGHACDHDVQHMPIFYHGEFSTPARAGGTWIIRATPILLRNGRALKMPETNGVWSIDAEAA